MSIHWYDSDRISPISFPLNIGSFSTGESKNRLLWFYSDFSLHNLSLAIEANGDESWKAWMIAKDFNTRPQAFVDYLSKLYWKMIPANTWTPVWIKFKPNLIEEQDNVYTINLRMIGDEIG